MIDLTTQTNIQTVWEYDQNTDILVVRFKDQTGVTEFGTLSIEGNKFVSLAEMMKEIGDTIFPSVLDTTTRVGHITHFSNQDNTAKTEFA